MKLMMDPVTIFFLSLFGGVTIFILNFLGAIPVLFLKRVSQKFLDMGLGFAAGVMLGASFTSLIVPGIEYGGVFPVIFGIVVGSLTVALTDKFVPHLHFLIGKEGADSRIRAVWLFLVAIMLHNAPEGLIVGIGFGSGNIDAAYALMWAIGFQNIPEGLSVGFSFISTGKYSRNKAFILSTLSGLVEIPLAIVGGLSLTISQNLVPLAMGFGAGAMIFVISDEIIPETHRIGHEKLASYGLVLGLIVMLLLDTVLG
ncbi:MAG: ZIP family metal transporter [Nitrososphaeria archaeon]|nr:ZIP family metal transporter [Nitrososphaeria archaeon]